MKTTGSILAIPRLDESLSKFLLPLTYLMAYRRHLEPHHRINGLISSSLEATAH